VPVSSAYCYIVSFLLASIIECSSWRLSLLLTIYSPSTLSYSLTLFYNALTCNLWADAFFLSVIISPLFSEMPLCISEHMRPYYSIVKLFLSILFANISCWLYSVVQLFVTFSSNCFRVLFASISYFLMKAVSSVYCLSWLPTCSYRCCSSASTLTVLWMY
jgi:hypothetical protein